MKVDRTRFLLLTAAIAGTAALASGAGCTVNNTNVNADGGTTQGDSSTGGDSTTGDSATGDSATGDSAATDTGADGAMCDDTTGSAPDCNAAFDAGAGCGMNATFQARCAAWVANLKPVVATAAVNCAIALPTCESGAGTEVCLTNALAASCADTTAVAICTTIDGDCADAGGLDSGVTDQQCATYVSGLNSAGRTAIQGCFDNGMCATEFPDCISNTLLPP